MDKEPEGNTACQIWPLPKVDCASIGKPVNEI